MNSRVSFKKTIAKEKADNRNYRPQVERFRKNVGSFHEHQDDKVQ